ncbi:uncharacterized protein QYS62_010750 [Fusarium acuminatum]|uniref:Uncharacterized protein n=1 Tax=Fusarium acuminatum TaxID=5515 RepID=A0ABZ2X8X6_9HYPO
MAQYSQVQQGLYDLSPKTGPSICNPNDPFNYRHFNTGKPMPSPNDIKLNTFRANQHLMYENEPIVYSHQPLKSRPLWKRLGKTGITILGLGTLIILVACALLVYLWQGAEKARNRQPRGEVWDRIVFNGYATQLVTICSAAIRSSIGFQIGLLSAAMAAVILETSGCRLSDLATLSLSRAFGSESSPWEIFLIAKGNRKILSHSILLLLTTILSLAMTSFTSTILLFDFDTIPVAAPNTTQSINIGFDINKETAVFAGISYWQSKPLAHWRFAEARPPNADQTIAPKDITDTGDIYRAFIPMGSVNERTSLEYYSGPTVVGNVRTACVRSNFLNASLQYVDTGDESTSGLYLQAKLDGSTGWSQGPTINETQPARISCRINNEWLQANSTYWPLSLCSFNRSDKAPVNQSLKNPLSRRPYGFRPVLLLNASDALNGLAPVFNEETQTMPSFAVPESLQVSKFSRDGPWTTAKTANGTELFQASVCFLSQFTPLLYNVTMSGRAITSEPTSIARWQTLQGQNGTDFLKQQEAGSSFEARGILGLDILEGPSSMASTGDENWDEMVYWMIYSSLFKHSISGGWTFNNDAITSWFGTIANWPAHPEHSHLLQTVLQKTDDPAQAVQALFFRLYQMIFYDLLPYFTQEQSAVTVHVKHVLVPSRWRGLVIVMAGVILHFCLTSTTLLIFAVSTKSSMLGNAWQAVSQIISPETRVVVEAVSNNDLKDVDVAKWVKSTTHDEHVYGLSTSFDNGGSRIRRI